MTSALKARARGSTVFTIGYEGRSVEDLVRTLIVHRVDVLVDVRENAVSRKRGFSKRQLAAALLASGIEYAHEPMLGNPRDNRPAFRSVGASAGRRRYLGHLNNGSRAAFDELARRVARKRVALLCFERDDAFCHRACIAEQAAAENPALSVVRL